MVHNRARGTLVGCLTLLLVVASCGGDDDDELSREGVDEATQPGAAATVDLPAREAPFEFAELDLPDDVSEVVGLMSRLPDSIAGFEQADPVHGEGDVRVNYGESESAAVAAPEIAFRALNLASSDGAYPPDWTAAQVIERASVPGDDVLDAGIDGEIAWARMAFSESSSTSAEQSSRVGVIFGETTGHWVFSVEAGDDDLLTSALATFVEAATSGG